MKPINIDTATEADIMDLIAQHGEVAVSSERGGPDRGIAFINEGDEGGVWVRWESGVTTPVFWA